MSIATVKKMRGEESAEVKTQVSGGEGQHDCDRFQKIAEMAYYKAEQRGFEPGRDQEDWLEAERELDLMQKG